MKVRVLTAMPPSYSSGVVVDVADALAHAWIGSGRAEAVVVESSGAVLPPSAPLGGKKRGKAGTERATADPADDPATESRG